MKQWFNNLRCLFYGSTVMENSDSKEDEWTVRGRELGKQHDFDEAIVCFDKVLEKEPQSIVAWYNKGVCWMNLGLYDAALHCFDKALNVNPKDAQVIQKRAVVAARMKKCSASSQSDETKSPSEIDDVSHLKTMPYNDYLQTEHWKQVRKRALDYAGHRCQLYNAAHSLQVHHRTYERRGCEEPIDVTVLCAYCHAKHHDKMGRSYSTSHRRRRKRT